MTNAKSEIGVWNDWGTLREVMVGYPDEMVEAIFGSLK